MRKVVLYKLRLSIRVLSTIAKNQPHKLFIIVVLDFDFTLFVLSDFC